MWLCSSGWEPEYLEYDWPRKANDIKGWEKCYLEKGNRNSPRSSHAPDKRVVAGLDTASNFPAEETSFS